MLHNIVQGLANAQIANILTIVFVALIFISVMWGLFRGFKKSIFYSIFYVIACAILFLSLDKIASLALSFDISWLGYSINGVKLVTLGDSVPELLRSILSQGNGADLSTMFVKGTESYTLVNTVLGSIVQFAVVLAFVLLFQTVYKLFIWLLWLIIGKPFDRRRVRVRGKTVKKPKNGTGGALVGFIPGLISVVMLFVPLSGVFSIAQSMTRVEVKNGVSFGDYLDESDYHLLQQVLGQYEESVPGKLFNIKTSEDGRSLDLWLLDKCITVEVDGNKFNIREDIENMGEFASNMAATGLLDVMLDGESSTHDLVNVVNDNEDKIVKAFSSLGDIELIDLLLNTGIEYLDCSRIIDDTLELSSDSINYENLAKLDWSKELAQIGNIFISAVDILSLVPDSSLTSPTIELDKVDLDKLNNDDILETFVNELFESNIINEGATAGLAYVLGIDNVKEIVGEFDKDELKNVDLKADLLRVVEATKSILNIGMDNLKNIDLKELSNKSQELKVIVDELLSMEIFTLVEENVIDYAITNYVENNENIKKFVDVEELRELRLVDFKRELGYVIDTFGRLGSETKLFELDGAENILMDKLNMDAFNSNALRIIVDNVDKSTTIQDFMDDILRGALVPSIFTEEKYDDLLTKENFEWSDELYVLVDLLKAIETNNSDFNIYVMATSEEKEITVGMLKGLYGVDENNEYIIDKSIFVEEMMLSVINKATEGNDFEGAFDDVDSLGVELEALTEMMIDAGIVEDRNDYVVDFNNISNEFDGVNLKMLRSLSVHIGESNILRSIIDTKITDFKVNDKEVIDTTDWDANKYTEEFTVLYEVLEASGKIDEEEKTPFNELGNLFSDSIPLTMLEEVSNEVGHSEILQSTMKIALEEQFENTDFESWTNEDWTNETTSLYNIINDGELYTIDSEGDKVINLDEFTNLDEIKLITIEAFKDNVKDSTLIQDVMSDELDSIMGEDYDFTTWDGNKWETEMGALYNISKTVSSINDKGEEVISFDDFEDMSEIKMTTIKACRNNVKNSEMIQKVMQDNLDPVMGEDYDYSSWDGNKWEDEMIALYNVSGTMSTKNDKNEDVINFDDFEDMSEIKIATIKECSINIEYSEMIQKVMQDNLDPVMGEDYDYSSWDGGKWRVEVTALHNVSETMSTKNDKDEDVVNFDDFEDMEEIKLTTVAACRDNINGSEMIQKVMQDNLDPVMGEDYDYSSWNDDKWEDEMVALYNVSETISTKNDKNEDVVNFDDFEDMDEIKLTTIEACKDNVENSEMIQKVMQDNLDTVMGEDYDYSSWDGGKWRVEMTALYNVSGTMSTKNDKNEDVVNFDDFEDMEEIKMTTVAACRDNVNGSEMIQKVMQDNLDPVMGEDYDYSSWNGNKWEVEMTALYNVSGTMSTKNDKNEDVVNFDDFEDMEEIKMTTVAACRDNVNGSEMIQKVMQDNLDPVMGEDYDYSSWDGNKWEVEMTALYNVSGTMSTKNDKNEDVVNFDDFEDMEEIKMTTVAACRDNINGSEMIQKVMQDNLDSIMGEDYDYSSWDGNKWEVEMISLYEISDTIKTKNANNEFVIDLSDDLIEDKVKVETISALSDNSHSDIVRNSMQESIDDMIKIDNSPEKSCMPIYDLNNVVTYTGWDDNQWEYELGVLEVISVELQDADGYLDTTNISENLKDLKVSFLAVIVDLVYGDLNGNKYNSYILQAQLVEPVESMMNSNGDNPNFRKLHPVEGVDYNYVSDKSDLSNIHNQNVPEYDDYDFTLDGNVGTWWKKELGALYLLAADKFGVDGSIPTENFNFDDDTKVSTINVIRDNIENSYVLQSCMRKVIDDVMNQDRSVYPSYEKYECENWSPSKWHTEIMSIRNAAKTLASTSLIIVNNPIDPDNYTSPSWILEDNDDDKFFFNLSSIEIEDSSGVSIHTLYYLNLHSKESDAIRSLLRVHLAEILGDISDDSFVREWLGNSEINDGVNNYVNRWEYEMEGFFNITCHLVNNENKVELGTSMFNELPIGVFDVLNGAFKNNVIDTTKIAIDHGYVSDYDGNKYHSELVRKMLLDALPVSSKVDPSSWKNIDNQWAYEMYAISMIAYEFAGSNGKVDFNNITFDDGNGNTIIKISVLDALSHIIHYSTFMQEKLCNSIFAQSNTKDTTQYPELEYLNPNDDNHQWNNEIRALYNVINNTSYVDNVTGEFNPDDLDFDSKIDVQILENLANNIHNSTYLQSELETTIEDLVDNIDSSRSDIIEEYSLVYSNGSYKFDLKTNYGDLNHAWRIELKTIFGIILDDDSGLVHTDINGKKYVEINEIKNDLNNLKINLLELASIKLEEFDEVTYGSSKVVRLNLVRPLEELANNLIGVTHRTTDFKWTKVIDGINTVPSDLKDLADFFSIIGAENVNEADLLLDDPSILIDHKEDIRTLDSRSYYINKMLLNNGIDFSLIP